MELFLVDPKYDFRDRLHFNLIFIAFQKAVDSKNSRVDHFCYWLWFPTTIQFFLIIPKNLVDFRAYLL